LLNRCLPAKLSDLFCSAGATDGGLIAAYFSGGKRLQFRPDNPFVAKHRGENSLRQPGPGPEDLAKRLIQGARSAGGPDNISCVVLAAEGS